MGEQNDVLLDNKYFRGLVIAALLSGSAGGLGSLTKDTSDRFKGADFRREITIRDTRIAELTRKQREHERHSAIYTERIKELIKDHEELRTEVHAHQRGGMHRQ